MTFEQRTKLIKQCIDGDMPWEGLGGEVEFLVDSVELMFNFLDLRHFIDKEKLFDELNKRANQS